MFRRVNFYQPSFIFLLKSFSGVYTKTFTLTDFEYLLALQKTMFIPKLLINMTFTVLAQCLYLYYRSEG